MLPCLALRLAPRMRLIIVGLIALLVIGGLLTSVVAARVRAQSRVGWLESKYLTLAPGAQGGRRPPPDRRAARIACSCSSAKVRSGSPARAASWARVRCWT